MCVNLPVCMCTIYMPYLQRPEEGIRSPELQLQAVGSSLMQVLGTELGSSARAVSVFFVLCCILRSLILET